MKTNRFIIIFCVLFVYSSMFFVSNVSLVQAQSLSASPDKIFVAPGQKITVNFSGAPGNSTDIVRFYQISPSEKELAYQWLSSKKSGSLSFNAPEEPGTYEFRMFASNKGNPIARSNRIVTEWKPVKLSHKIGTHYIEPSKKVEVSFTDAPGYSTDIIRFYQVSPSEKELAYQWLSSKKSGVANFNAPEEPGTYEFRMFARNDMKVMLGKSTSFKTEWKPVKLSHKIGTHNIGPSKKVEVSFTDAPGYSTDIIRFYQVSPSEKELAYQWLSSKKSGVANFNAPEEPGTYEFRMFARNDMKVMLGKSTSFKVQWGPVSIKVAVHSADAQGKRKLTVQYGGAPGYSTDIIRLVRVQPTEQEIQYLWLSGKTSGALELTCPNETDTYELRLFARNDKNVLLAKTQAFIPKNGPPPPVDQGPGDTPPPPPPPTPDPPPPAPDKPFTLRAYPGDGKVFLEWTPPQNTSKVIGYNLYRKTSRIPYGSPITDFPIKGLNHMDMNVDNGMQACYYMKAVYSDKTESSASNEVCVTPNAPKATINIPANATTTQSSYTFTGKVPPGSTVMVNGIPVTVGPDGSFTATVKLNPGKNTISIVVKTKTGETITSTHTVTLTTGADGKITIILTIGSKNAYVNQQLVVLDVAPFIDSGRTFVPFRFVGESLGAEVGYTTDASGRVATVTYKLGSTSIILYIGRKDALVNGRTVYLDVAPKIVQGRTVIPLRFVTEALGCKVDWDGQAMKVTIIYPA
ncbi:MAG TPA: stalk domain-containing protein [Caldisericia bacterium]|nr:stalk domain-containing protein [Caldisericia bacterium]